MKVQVNSTTSSVENFTEKGNISCILVAFSLSMVSSLSGEGSSSGVCSVGIGDYFGGCFLLVFLLVVVVVL